MPLILLLLGIVAVVVGAMVLFSYLIAPLVIGGCIALGVLAVIGIAKLRRRIRANKTTQTQEGN